MSKYHRLDSNQHRAVLQTAALPLELLWHNIPPRGLEPRTHRLEDGLGSFPIGVHGGQPSCTVLSGI